MKKILLMGNPNVGKSVIFARLSGINVVSANYPGTTVEFARGYLKFGQERAEIIDVPGTYSLTPTSPAEEVACQILKQGNLVVNVVDATNLERNLNLTLQLLQQNIPMVVVLNFWDEVKHIGIAIDTTRLEEILGVPVIPTCALTGEGISALHKRLGEAEVKFYHYEEEERWHEVGKIIKAVQKISHRHHSFLERVGDASIQPVSGFFIACLVIFFTFLLVRIVGEGLANYFLVPFFEKFWRPVLVRISSFFQSVHFLHSILIGPLKEGKIDFYSWGVLTTGLFIPLAQVLPYVFAFYFILGILEDSGYLPRLGILVDKLMHYLGVHGLSIIPLLLGLGCNVPGALAARIMETKREKFIILTLMAIAVPCMSQIAMVTSLLGPYGVRGLGVWAGAIFLVWVLVGTLLNRLLKGESPEIFLEIPPYRCPYPGAFLKKLGMRIKWFVKDALPFVFLGVLLVNILYSIGLVDFLNQKVQATLRPLFGLPAEVGVALLIGFLRKDMAVGMLAPLNLTLKQLIIACVILTMYFPCAASFIVLIREMGIKQMMKALLLMGILTILVGAALNLIL